MVDWLRAMSGAVSVTAVLGVGPFSPHCYVLRVDEWSLLLDCGWDASMDESLFTPAACALLASVDAVLISHSAIRHCGALPYIHRRLALNCPVYATLPVWRMGAMTLYDHYQQHIAGITPLTRQQSQSEAVDEANELFSLDDIDAVFDNMRLLKYSEEMPLSDKLAPAASSSAAAPTLEPSEARSSSSSASRIVISPHASGHSVGGCVWRIVCEGAVLLYAVDYNHGRERHLQGGVLEAFTRPSLLIMDTASLAPPPTLSSNTNLSRAQPATTTRKIRESSLLDAVLGCVNGGGVCLLPVDSAGRVLELLVLLHLTWEASRMYERVPLLFASPQSGTTIEFVQQQVEWLSDAMQKHFNTERSNPFHLPHVHTVTDIQQVDSITQHCTKPAVILATSHTLQPNSLSLAVLERIAQQPASLVLFTQDIEYCTLAHDLFTRAAQAGGAPFSVSVQKPSRVALEGEELRQYLLRAKVREEQRQLENNQQTAMDGQRSDDDDDNDDDSEQTTAAVAQQQSTKQQSTAVTVNGHGHVQHSPPSFASPPLLSSPVVPSSLSAACFPHFYQFPFSDPRRQSDLYGEMIDHSQSHSQPLSQPPQQQPLSASSASPASSPSSTSHNHPAATIRFPPGMTVPPAAFQPPSTPPAASASSPPPELESSSPPVSTKPSVATKCVWRHFDLPVLCGVSYVDFRGVSDATGWKNIVSHVKPRKLLLIHGRDEDKVAFRQYCIERRICAPAATAQEGSQTTQSTATVNGTEAAASQERVVSDKLAVQGEEAASTSMEVEADDAADELEGSSRSQLSVSRPSTSSLSSGVLIATVLSSVDISSDLSYRFGMAPSLLSRLRFARVAEYEVAHTTAVVSQSESALPQLVSVDSVAPSPAASASTAASSQVSGSSVFLGDYRFADFRRVLAVAGIDSEFYVKGGVLVAAGGSVRIRKTAPNTLTVQGVISERFYAVRQLLYSQYSVVTPHAD